MDNAALESIYIGFDNAIPGTWKLLKSNTGQVIDTIHAIFNENIDKQTVSILDRSRHTPFQQPDCVESTHDYSLRSRSTNQASLIHDIFNINQIRNEDLQTSRESADDYVEHIYHWHSNSRINSISASTLQ
jgi:hypothetical protein